VAAASQQPRTEVGLYMYVCVCVCVCEKERKTERGDLQNYT